MIYIGVLNTENLNPESEKVIERIPEEVREKVENTKNENEKRLRAGAYILLDEIYKKYAENAKKSPEMPQILYTGDGKPRFESVNKGLQNAPFFSISHDTSLSCVAISDGNLPVGVDVQSLPRGRVRIEKIAERFLAPLRRLDVQFARGEMMGEVIYEDEPSVKFFFYEIKDGCLCLTPEEKFYKTEISRNDAEADFLAKWTLLEAIIKASGGGFGEASSVGQLTDGVISKTVTLSVAKRKYALTVAEIKKR